jgi:hypothetical protein
MPVLNAAGNPFTLCDLVPEVIKKVENRTEDESRASQWLRESLIEIASDPQLRNEFDELEIEGPFFNLTAAQGVANAVQEYLFDNLIPEGDQNVATLDVMLWTDPPLNTNRIRLVETSYQDSDRISPYPGQPCKWYRFNNMIGFSPAPNQAYQVQARIYRAHPIVYTSCETTILLPQDWFEIIVYGAVMRGFIELLEYEKASKIRELLYGDPKYPDRVGLIESRKKRREKEAWRQQRALKPVVRRYGHGGF